MPKLRSGLVIDPDMDELSGLFSKKVTVATPRTKKIVSEEDMFSSMFGKLTIGKSIGKSKAKSRRRKGVGYSKKTKTKTQTKKTPGMDLTGGRGRSRGRSRVLRRSRKYRYRRN
jgi:hypothetical protein